MRRQIISWKELSCDITQHRQNRRESPIAVWKLADASIHEDYCRELSDRLGGVDLMRLGVQRQDGNFEIVWLPLLLR